MRFLTEVKKKWSDITTIIMVVGAIIYFDNDIKQIYKNKEAIASIVDWKESAKMSNSYKTIEDIEQLDKTLKNIEHQMNQTNELIRNITIEIQDTSIKNDYSPSYKTDTIDN